MEHPHAQLLEKIYTAFVQGDFEEVLSHCAENMTFQIPGKSPLAGKYDRNTFASGFVAKMDEFSGGTFKMEIHDILASDRHGLVLATDTLTRNGKHFEYRTVHVWRIEGGKPVAWYEYPRDLYQYDAIWG